MRAARWPLIVTAVLITAAIALGLWYGIAGHRTVTDAVARGDRVILRNLVSGDGPFTSDDYVTAADRAMGIAQWVLWCTALALLAGWIGDRQWGRLYDATARLLDAAVTGRWPLRAAAGAIVVAGLAWIAAGVLQRFPNSGDEYLLPLSGRHVRARARHQPGTSAPGVPGLPPHPAGGRPDLQRVPAGLAGGARRSPADRPAAVARQSAARGRAPVAHVDGRVPRDHEQKRSGGGGHRGSVAVLPLQQRVVLRAHVVRRAHPGLRLRGDPRHRRAARRVGGGGRRRARAGAAGAQLHDGVVRPAVRHGAGPRRPTGLAVAHGVRRRGAAVRPDLALVRGCDDGIAVRAGDGRRVRGVRPAVVPERVGRPRSRDHRPDTW